MENYRFIELVEKEKGFEYYQAFRDEVDWVIGGKDDTFWFTVLKEQSVKETYIGTLKDGVWVDHRIKGKGKRRTVKEMPAGSTIKRIEERAFFMQDAEWVMKRKPRLIEDAHPHYHYVYGIGDKALDVSDAYGVSIAYSDIKDPSAGFHLRYLYTGNEVKIPSGEDFRKVIDINLNGVFYGIKYAAIQMKKQGTGGAIVNTSSIEGFVGDPVLPSYNAAKGGVNILTKSSALSLAKDGIRVNSVNPGYITTGMVNEDTMGKEGIEYLISLHPLGRLGTSEEIAHGVVFLIENEFVTGFNLLIDGGYTAQ